MSTTTQSKHTPISVSFGGKYAYTELYDSGDEVIAQVFCDDFARFAVRACNSHDDLLAALERLVRDQERPGFSMDREALPVARAAIAKARGS